jgi:hypothetical protein
MPPNKQCGPADNRSKGRGHREGLDRLPPPCIPTHTAGALLSTRTTSLAALVRSRLKPRASRPRAVVDRKADQGDRRGATSAFMRTHGKGLADRETWSATSPCVEGRHYCLQRWQDTAGVAETGAGSPRRCCRACSRRRAVDGSRRSAARAKAKDVIREGPSSDGPAAGSARSLSTWVETTFMNRHQQERRRRCARSDQSHTGLKPCEKRRKSRPVFSGNIGVTIGQVGMRLLRLGLRLMMVRTPSLQFIQVMDLIDPASRQRLARNVVDVDL